MDAGDRQRVLGRQRGDGAGAVDAEGGKRFQIRLNAGAAARIAPSNCQGCRPYARISPVCRLAARLTFMDAALVVCRGDHVSTPLKLAATLFMMVLTAAAAQISVPLPFTPVPVHVPADGGAARRRGARSASSGC